MTDIVTKTTFGKSRLMRKIKARLGTWETLPKKNPKDTPGTIMTVCP